MSRPSPDSVGLSQVELQQLLGTAEPMLPSSELMHRALHSAQGELVRTADESSEPKRLPRFFRRELLRLVAATALPALGLVALNLSLASQAPAVLSSWLPAGLVWALTASYAIGSLGWLALAYATVPFAAHRRATMRVRALTPDAAAQARRTP